MELFHSGKEAELIKAFACGVTAPPALAADGKAVFFGRALKNHAVRAILNEARG